MQKLKMVDEIRVDILNELQGQKTSGSQASSSHDDQTIVPTANNLGLNQDKQKQPEEMNRKENDENAGEEKDLAKHCLGALIQDDQKLLAELKREESEAQSSQPRATIHKVPQIMLENENIQKYFRPRQISIGPLHANDPRLSKRELKVKLAREFINFSGVTADTLFDGIKNKIEGLKKFFGKDMIPNCYDDNSLARLFFLDGCVVLQFMRSYDSSGLTDFKIKKFEAAFIKLDLFLLENQIPFEVLKLLMDNIRDGDKRKEIYSVLNKFVRETNICASTANVHNHEQYECKPIDDDNDNNTKKPVHLLDLLRMVCTDSSGHVKKRDGKPNEIRCFRNVQELKSSGIRTKPNEIRYFRNVQELKSSGIRTKPSGSHCLNSVSFHTHCFGIRGHLKLPILTMKDSTVCKLLNLAAYEMWLDDNDDHNVTSYLALMNMLIDSEQDVKDLRIAKILRNPNLSDAEIAQLFNMTDSIYLSKDHDCYVGIKNKIEAHYRKRCAIWIAEVFTNHFSSPWSIVAFGAAVIALLLTSAQTWYASFPKSDNYI